MNRVALLAVTIGACAYLAYRNDLGSNFQSFDWQEVATKASQAAGPVLKHTLPFIAVTLMTGYAAIGALYFVANKSYPETEEGKYFYFDRDLYRKLPTFSKVGRALFLVLTSTAVGAGLGGAMMKGVTTILQLSTSYFKNTTIALTIMGASGGALFVAKFHNYLEKNTEATLFEKF